MSNANFKPASFLNRPIPGRAYKPFSKFANININPEDIANYFFSKIVIFNNKDFVIFKNRSSGSEIMQSVKAIKYVRCKSGEENINSKLSNVQRIQIFEKANTGSKIKDLAQEFGVSRQTISGLKSGQVSAKIINNHINNVSIGKANPVKIATNSGKSNTKTKLSPSIAQFIRNDSKTHKIKTKDLAKKYCVSTRTIQRIVAGKMYAIKEQK
jgi:DNA-binding Xre family transcriptional regulator